MSDIRALEEALVRAHEAGDTANAQILADEIKRASSGSGRKASVAAPAGAAGAPDRLGLPSTGGQRDAMAVGAMAPAKMLAGLADAGYGASRWIGEKTGLVDPDSPREDGLSGPVGDLTNSLAGRKVPESVGRSAFEGAVAGPMGGGAAIPGVIAGAAGGGAAQWAAEKNLPWWAQLGIGMAAGTGASGTVNATRMRPSEFLSEGRLRKAVRGLSPDDLRTGQAASDLARTQGVNVLPGQALDAGGEGLTRLQAALMNSSADGAEQLSARAIQLPRQARTMVERLRNMGGQTPRDPDMLAEAVQEAGKGVTRSGPQAVNQATRPLYQAGGSPVGPRFGPANQQQLDTLFQTAIQQQLGDPTAQRLLQQAHARITEALAGRPTPEQIVNLVKNLKGDLPAGTDVATSATNRVRETLTRTLDQVRDQAEMVAPSLKAARVLQAELRESLPGKFDEMERLARKGGGAEALLAFAAKDAEIIGALQRRNPQLAQELVQWNVNTVAGKSLAGARPGTTAEAALRDAPELGAMFPRSQAPDADVSRLRRSLTAAQMAERPSGRMTAGDPNFTAGMVQNESREVARGLTGQLDHVAGIVGRLAASAGLRVSDAAALRVMQRPDALERIARLKALPPSQLTRATILAVLPELESQK